MRRMLFSALSTAILALFVFTVPAGAQYGVDADESGMTPELAKAYDDISEKYAPDLYALQGQMMGKQAELMGILSRKDVDKSRAEALAKDIGDMQAKAYRTRVSMLLELRAKGIPAAACLGYGMMGGYGRGMGYGMGYGMGRGMMDDDDDYGTSRRRMHRGMMGWGMMGY